MLLWLELPSHLVVGQAVGDPAGEQSHAAIDVVTDRPGRDHTIRRPGGRHAANRESVALMDIRHDVDVAYQAWKSRRIDSLIHGLVAQGVFKQRLIGKKADGNAHVLPVRRRDLPYYRSNPGESSFVDHTRPPAGAVSTD